MQGLVRQFKAAYAASPSIHTANRAPASEVASATGANRAIPQTQSDDWEYAYALGDSFAKCGLGAVDGFNAIVADPLIHAAKSIKNLATNTRAWISGSIEELRRLKETLVNFDAFARQQWSDWRKKPPAEKSRFYCSFLGGGFGMSAIAKGTGQLVTKASKVAEVRATTISGETGSQAAKEIKLYQSGKAPDTLSSNAQSIVQPNAPYIGRNWWEFPSEGSSAYPYLADRNSLRVLKEMSEKPLPDPAKFNALKDHDWKHAVQTLRDYPTNATQKIESALASPDIVIDGQKFVLVSGSKYANPRLASAADFRPVSEIRNNGLTGQRVFADDGKYRSISSPAIEYQGGGRTGYSTKVPKIQGARVRIVSEGRMIEGQYLSSGGQRIPRGAESTQISVYQQENVLVHFVQVGDQTLMIPAKGAEIFAKY